MAQTDRVLPLVCPRCQHSEARLEITSYTVLTVACVRCGHMWSSELAAVPDYVRRAARVIAATREISSHD